MRYIQSAGHSGCYGESSHLCWQRHFFKFCARVVRHPRIHVVLPLLFAVILSCKLLTYVVHPSQAMAKLSESQFVCKVELLKDTASNPVESQLSLVQIWMRSTEDAANVLKKRILLESLALQNKLLEGVKVEKLISSPFQLWSNSLRRLQSDPAPLRTINSRLMALPRYSLFGTWKINGLISSAAGITISLLVNNTEYPQLQATLNQNAAKLNDMRNVTNFHIFAQPHMDSIKTESLQLFLVKLGSKYKVIIFILHFALLLHLALSMKRLSKTVKSVLGISLAMVSQIIFTLASATTVTKFCFKSSSDYIPIRALSCAVIFFSLNEQIRLLEDTRGCSFEPKPAEDPERISSEQFYDNCDSQVDRSFVSHAASCHLSSTKSLVVLSLIVTVLIPFSRRTTLFLLLSFWFGHFLQCTFFTAVLSLDRRRWEDSDLLTLDNSLLLDDNISGRSKFDFENHLHSLRFICRNRYSVLLTAIYLLAFNIKFSVARSSSSLISKLFHKGFRHVLMFGKPVPHVIFDQRFIAEGTSKLINEANKKGCYLANLIVRDPFLVLKYQDGQNLSQLEKQLPTIFNTSSFTSSYKLDFYYVLEFLLFVILLLSCTMLILQKLTEKLDHINSFNLLGNSGLEDGIDIEDAKRSKDGKKYLQNLEDAQNVNGVDDTNIEITDHFHAKELYKGGHSLDIVGIATSKCPFVVSVGLDYKVYVWSPLLKPIPSPTCIPLPRKFWPLSKVVLSNDGYYVGFFGKNGSITTWSRRQMNFVWELQLKKNCQSKDSSVTAPPLEAFFRKITVPSARQKKLPTTTMLRPELGSRRSSVNSIDYAARLTEGGIDAAYEKVVFTHSDAEEKDELVFVTPSGFIYSIQTSGELNVEKLTVSDHSLKSCKLLSSPRVNDRLVACDMVGDLYVSTVVNNKWRQRKLPINYNGMLAPSSNFCEIKENSPGSPTSQETRLMSKTDYTIELVSFVGLILRVIGREAELIDAMTGTVIRTFTIGLFKAGSLRVFHDNPTHCRFCGSASVASFSIAYNSFENERRVTLHTFKLESRTKNSICMRVERDPREIRCLGMESTFETIHYFYDAEDWCVTDNNMLIGIRRVPQDIPAKVGTTSISRIVTEDDESGVLMKRKPLKSAGEQKTVRNSEFCIHNIWEGWTMSAAGKISLHKIPMGVNGLIVNRLGPVARYGAKAMIVGFANIMNLFYIGHEELIFNPEKEDANQEELSLRFVNKRRDRLSSKKSPLNYSSL
ncbi:(ZYRO0E04224g) [Zygosaccharomyces parabailii]|nr:(ZYRO0E04224g) [Zygosaccharomyces parabailii]